MLEGIARAKQDVLNRGAEYPVLPLLVHGDAAFAGQGVVAETLNLSQLRGYRTGGTIHLVVNNQVGFTTSPGSSRSSLYCTDVARMVQAPIFHVNGDDPEACIRVARLAFEYRQAFNKDVVIDLVCYRRRGHNEGDDPSYTQPLMYDLIEQKRSVRKLYTESLIGRGDITIEEAEQVLRDYQQQLERVFTEVREASSQPSEWTTVPDYPDKPAGETQTAVSAEVLKRIADAYVTPPDGFTVHPKVMPQLQRRAAAITDGPIDWGTGEILAFGSLLMDGRPVRLAGQDSRRGTFVSRFATIIDRRQRRRVDAADLRSPRTRRSSTSTTRCSPSTPRSGFEYGYSVARPEALVLWEAQFGDFVNGAQTVIDEFITSGETKWRQQSGVVLLLPHGYEGQGPDHSSARIERFMTMAADEAFVVAQPSTPASYFHLLRQHSLGEEHRPLIVFTPKSMLKRKEAASQAGRLHLRHVPAVHRATPRPTPDQVDTLLLCSGRVTWDLMVERAKREDAGRFAIARVEQLYPRPEDEIRAGDRPVPEPQGGALGAGRAGEHGPVAALPAQRVAARRTPRSSWSGARSPPPPRSAPSSGTPRSRRTCSLARSPERSRSEGRGAGPSPQEGRVGARPRHEAVTAVSRPTECRVSIRSLALATRPPRGAPCTSPTAASRSSTSAGVTRRSPWRGSPSGSRSSPTPTRSSRPPWSGSRPGWPGWTTRRTDRLGDRVEAASTRSGSDPPSRSHRVMAVRKIAIPTAARVSASEVPPSSRATTYSHDTKVSKILPRSTAELAAASWRSSSRVRSASNPRDTTTTASRTTARSLRSRRAWMTARSSA